MMLSYPYVHKVRLNDYILKVFLGMNEVFYAWLVNVWSECCDAHCLTIGLLRMSEVMGLHIYISLADLD